MNLLHALRDLLRGPDFYALSLGHGPALLAGQQPTGRGAGEARGRRSSRES